MAGVQLKEGEVTSTVYGLIKEQRYSETVQLLNNVMQTYSKSRPALSLLGYCYYQMQDFVNAADCYEQLTLLNPEVDEYRLYYAQSLYKASLYDEAMKVSCQIDNAGHHAKIVKLQAGIKYGQEDYSGAKSLVDQCPTDDLDTEVNLGCLLFKEGRYEEALRRFTQVQHIGGYKPDLAYNIALCHYMMKQYAAAHSTVGDIIAKGIKEHPELGVGMNTEGIEVRSVGNTLTLHETALIESFNLQAAIEYQHKHYDSACIALTDMPPRSEHELDPVTLHNQALMNMEQNPTEGFEKLQFLLQQNPFPPETFANLLLLYVKYEYFDLAADVLAENAHLTYKYLTPYLYEFLEAVIMRQTAPEEAYRKFDEMAAKLAESLRKCTKQVQEARKSHDDEGAKQAIHEFDETIDRYMPVLMQQTKIYWDLENYMQVEKIFRKSVEFCNDQDVWKLNVAHVLFMQENKYKEAAGFYEPIVKKNYENILDISAAVLANLCVSYIMTSQNEEAEELMRKIEKEEEHVAYDQPNKKIFHLCIVNLVIGTLYCAKGNYEFGISRVIKSLEPYQKKLGTDTWYYAKRCFLSLIENMAKHMLMMKDAFLHECIQFLESCELYGREVKAHIEAPLEQEPMHPGKNTVTYEARLLKALLLQLM
jgi:tetratricopeptide repeat protein 30